jgi:hypothetical protein
VPDGVPPAAIETVDSDANARHLAMTHEDTTEGAVHCFQDEFGTSVARAKGKLTTQKYSHVFVDLVYCELLSGLSNK